MVVDDESLVYFLGILREAEYHIRPCTLRMVQFFVVVSEPTTKTIVLQSKGVQQNTPLSRQRLHLPWSGGVQVGLEWKMRMEGKLGLGL